MELYLGPGFAVYSFLFNKVALHSFTSVALWSLPGESAGSSGYVAHLQVSRGSWQVYKHTERSSTAPQPHSVVTLVSVVTAGRRGVLPSTMTLTLTTLCPAGLSALMMYLPLWFSLLSGITMSELVSVE